MNSKCPYCGNEMEEGIIQTGGNNLFWDKQPRGAFITVPSKQGIKLNYRPFGAAYLENVYYCKACNIFIFQKNE